MSKRTRPRGFCLFLLLSALTTVATAADGPARKYSITLDSKLKITTEKGEAVNMNALTRFDYGFKPAGAGKIESSIDGLELTIAMQGQPANTTKMNRDAFVTPDGMGGTRTIPAQDAPPQLKEILAQFGAPLAVHTIGAEGEETEPLTLKIKKGILTETNAHLLTRIFHVKFPKNQQKWTVPMEVPMGQGQSAKGDVTFEKTGLPGSDGSTRVKVSGRLKAEGKLGAATIKQGTYDLSGLQLYSPKLADWSSGTYEMKINFDAVEPTQGAFNGNGTMSLILKTRP